MICTSTLCRFYPSICYCLLWIYSVNVSDHSSWCSIKSRTLETLYQWRWFGTRNFGLVFTFGSLVHKWIKGTLLCRPWYQRLWMQYLQSLYVLCIDATTTCYYWLLIIKTKTKAEQYQTKPIRLLYSTVIVDIHCGIDSLVHVAKPLQLAGRL